MNPFQHSALAALIYEVLEYAENTNKLRAEQEVLGDLACTIAQVLAKKRRVKLGRAPDRLAAKSRRIFKKIWASPSSNRM